MKRSQLVPIRLILIVIIFILGLYILMKFLSILKYDGRLSCKLGNGMALLFTSPFSVEDKLKTFAEYGSYIGSLAAASYATYKIKGYMVEEIDEELVERGLRDAIKTFIREDGKALLKRAGEFIKSKYGIALVGIGIIAGIAYHEGAFDILNAFKDLTIKLSLAATRLCKPEVIILDVKGDLDCNFLKNVLTDDAYKALVNKFGECSSNSNEWKKIALEVVPAYLAKLTYEEGLRDATLPYQTYHYILVIMNNKYMGTISSWTIVCWWNFIRYKNTNYFNAIYGTKKEYINQDEESFVSKSIYSSPASGVCADLLQALRKKNPADIYTTSDNDKKEILSGFLDKDGNYVNPYSLGRNIVILFSHANGMVITTAYKLEQKQNT